MLQKAYLDQEIYLSNRNECMTSYFAGYKKALEELSNHLPDLEFSFKERIEDLKEEDSFPNEVLLQGGDGYDLNGRLSLNDTSAETEFGSGSK
jgi:hypothetical protein